MLLFSVNSDHWLPVLSLRPGYQFDCFLETNGWVSQSSEH
jgi:hypothetical protein